MDPAARTDERIDDERRRVLLGLAALAASGAVGPLAAQAPPAPLADPQGFAALTRTMAGHAFADSATATAMLDALTQAVGADTLRRIATLATVTPPAQLGAELATAGLATQAETVVAALYTGQVGTRVISYDGALVWQALGWTKPNASCGGTTGYWADKPAAT
jgi:hypothetical protein